MNWRETAVRVTLIFLVFWGVNTLIVWGINHFLPKKTETAAQTTAQSGQQFEIVAKQMSQPLKREVDFVDVPSVAGQRVVAQGRDVTYTFTTAGGALDSFSSRRRLGDAMGELTTIEPVGATERSRAAFLVAFDEMTPFNYQLVSSKDEKGESVVTMVGESPLVRVTKEYRIARHGLTCDLVLTVEPLNPTTPVQPRIFLPGPFMPMLGDREMVGGVVGGMGKKGLDTYSFDQVANFAWAAPELFGVQDKYFVNTLVRDPQSFLKRGYFRQDAQGRLTAIYEGPEVTKPTTWKLTFYLGAKEAARLAEVNPRLEVLLNYGWLAPISKALLFLLNFLYGFVGNYGWAIIILTLLIRLLLFPLTARGQRSMEKQKEVARRMKYLKEKYGDDRERLQREQMELMREHGFFPGGVGCLPLFLQFPIFIGLNYALSSSIELYRAPFMLWMTDLSARDPYYVIPVLVGLSLLLVMSSTPTDARQRATQKVTMVVMSLLVAGITMNLSVGLGLFIFVSSFGQYLENRVIKLWRHR